MRALVDCARFQFPVMVVKVNHHDIDYRLFSGYLQEKPDIILDNLIKAGGFLYTSF